MKNMLLLTVLAAGSLALTACSDDKPAPVRRETTVHHSHTRDRSSTPSNNPDSFEPVERPATYSR